MKCLISQTKNGLVKSFFSVSVIWKLSPAAERILAKVPVTTTTFVPGSFGEILISFSDGKGG
jgi:hypothetical protein